MSEFREWVLSDPILIENDLTATEQKKLIALAGRIRPIIRDQIKSELTSNLREITAELTMAFYQAFHGRNGKPSEAETVWEFPLCKRPVMVDGHKVPLGSGVIAYQLPSGEAPFKEPELTQGEKDKFLRDREKFFVDFMKNMILNDSVLDQIADDFVEQIYKAVASEGKLQGPGAKILWKGNVTGGEGRKPLGRILLALRLPPVQEQGLERVVRGEGPVA